MSNRTLREIALTESRCRVLPPLARSIFADIAKGVDVSIEHEPQDIDDAFFASACTMATRAGQSMARRSMLEDLKRLRSALLAGETVPAYTATVSLRIEADRPEQVAAIVDTLRRFDYRGATITSASIIDSKGA